MKKFFVGMGGIAVTAIILTIIFAFWGHNLSERKGELNTWSGELASKEAVLNQKAEALNNAQAALNQAKNTFDERVQRAEYMRQLFTGFLAPSWEQQVKMARDSYGVLDQRFDQYRTVAEAMANLGNYNLTWEDVGINGNEVRSAHDRLGRTLATELIQCLDQPIESRRGHFIGQGEGSISLDDPWDVGREIVQLVNASGTTIKDYGLSPEQFRAKLVQDARELLGYARTLKGTEQYRWAMQSLGSSINEYNIAGRELGLTQKERDFLWGECRCYVR
ncbi:MAG: hypothetical protein WC497_04825 [Patescibacteria group bacterium]